MSTDASEESVFSQENQPSKLGMASQTCNPNTLEAEARASKFKASPGYTPWPYHKTKGFEVPKATWTVIPTHSELLQWLG